MDFMNDNWRDYLKSGDKVAMHAKINKSYIFWKSLIAAIIATFLLTPMLVVAADANDPIMALLVLPIPIVFFLKKLKLSGTHYALTQSGVYSIGGLFSKHVGFVAYARITDASVGRGIFEQMLGLGSIGISTAGGTKSAGGHSQPYEIVIAGVNDYHKIRQAIFRKMK